MLNPDSSYPLFAPPRDLAASKPRSWSLEDARRYAFWLERSVDQRTGDLLDYLGEPETEEPETTLARVGEKAAWQLRKPQFSVGDDLTEAGYALAADMGLLVAKYLLTRSEDAVRWQVLRRPKSDFSFHQPVLVGFGRTFLDPVRASMGLAWRILRSGASGRVWADLYSEWIKRARGAVGPAESEGS